MAPPKKSKAKLKRCTLTIVAGTFAHRDTAGANRVHLSGTQHGKKLAVGSYELRAIPNEGLVEEGKAVQTSFRVKH